MKFSYTTLFVLLFSSTLASPVTSEDKSKDNGIAVTLDGTVSTEGITVDIGADVDLQDNAYFNATAELDKRAAAPSLKSDMLKYHNAWRAHHGAPLLVWSTTLESFASQAARKCAFAHTPNNKFGENVAGGTYTNPAFYAQLWYNEVSKYNFNRPGFSSETGHFTQVVWKGTKQIGCAFVKGCSGGLPNLLFCEYSPAGNVQPASNFRANVLPGRSSPKNPAQPPPNL